MSAPKNRAGAKHQKKDGGGPPSLLASISDAVSDEIVTCLDQRSVARLLCCSRPIESLLVASLERLTAAPAPPPTVAVDVQMAAGGQFYCAGRDAHQRGEPTEEHFSRALECYAEAERLLLAADGADDAKHADHAGIRESLRKTWLCAGATHNRLESYHAAYWSYARALELTDKGKGRTAIGRKMDALDQLRHSSAPALALCIDLNHAAANWSYARERELTDNMACSATDMAATEPAAASGPIHRRRGKGQEDYLCTEDVLDTDQGKQVLAFRIRMQGVRPEPNVSYSDIIEFIEGLGIDPRSIISFTEAKWNTPSKSAKSPGENRHALSGQVMANLTAVLQGICGCGCGQRIDGYFADEMKAVHFDHLIEALKTDDANMLFRRNLDEMRGTVGQRAAAAKTMEEIRTLSAVLEQHHETRTPEEVVANADGRLLESRMPFRAA